jgi:23S rRNA (uracil1939-C5)-methyltransferase
MAADIIRAGIELTVSATSVDASGDGVLALDDGRTLVVPGLLPGEAARVVVTHVGRRSQRIGAKLRDVTQAHPERQRPPCVHQGRCCGCPLMVLAPGAQRALKRRLLAERHGIVVDDVVHVAGGERGYRWSSKRVAGGRAGDVLLGSYKRGSHKLALMRECLVDHPRIAASARAIERAASELGIEPYDERSQHGDLRYVWFKANQRGDVLVTLVTASADSRARELAAALDEVHGVSWCVQPSRGNAMRGSAAELLRGAATLEVELCGERVTVGPLGFLQPNPRVAELAYRDLVADGAGDVAFDLYAGAGVTTALLRRSFARVVACETDAAAAQALGIEPGEAIATLARAESGELPIPDLVVANPPRAGLGAEVCAALARLRHRGLQRLRIMSCDPASLARDLEHLAATFVLHKARAYDTLPETTHLEVVVWLETAPL